MMEHDIVDGVLAGLLGPHLAQWLSRYRYRIVFIVGAIATQLFFFIAGCIENGFKETVHMFFFEGSFWGIILVSMVLGLIAVFIAVLGSAGNPPENKNGPSDHKKDNS